MFGGTYCSPWSIEGTSDVSLVCDGGPVGLMELLKHALVTAHVGGTVCSPWSIGCTSDVSLVCDGGPVGLMELL